MFTPAFTCSECQYMGSPTYNSNANTCSKCGHFAERPDGISLSRLEPLLEGGDQSFESKAMLRQHTAMVRKRLDEFIDKGMDPAAIADKLRQEFRVPSWALDPNFQRENCKQPDTIRNVVFLAANLKGRQWDHRSIAAVSALVYLIPEQFEQKFASVAQPRGNGMLAGPSPQQQARSEIEQGKLERLVKSAVGPGIGWIWGKK